MTAPTLAQLLDVAEDHARRVRIEHQQQIIPLFDLRDADGDSCLVAGEFTGDNQDEVDRCKDAFAAFVRGKIAEHAIVISLLVHERGVDDRTTGIYPQASRFGRRRLTILIASEVVIATAQDGEAYLFRRWLMKRDKRGRVIDLTAVRELNG